jgi:hypothetical protein
MTNSSVPRRIMKTVVGNWASAAYLTFVAVVIACTGTDLSDFGAVMPLLSTSPTSWLFLGLIETDGIGALGFYGLIVTAALVNSAAIGLFAHWIGRVTGVGRRPSAAQVTSPAGRP